MSKKRKKRKNRNSSNVDFFGMKKSPSYLGCKSKINFLNSKTNKSKPLFNNSKPDWLKNKSLRQRKTNPLFNPLVVKNNKKITSLNKFVPKQKRLNWNYKQIKKKFPNFNPYGDADMDGSMNYKDCKPFDASRDGKIAEMVKGFLKEVEKDIKKEKRKEFVKRLAKVGEKLRQAEEKLLYKKVDGKVRLKGKKVSPKVLKAVALTGVPVRAPSTTAGKGKTYAGPGRPRGPSGKYVIPGRGPVYVGEYMKWKKEQRAKQRIEALSRPPVTTEMPEEVEETTQLTPEQIQQIRQMQQIQAAQQSAQQSAQQVQQRPSQMVGGPIGTNILQAPNVFKGELRDVGGKDLIELGEKPQANPSGEYYTNIDPISGRPVIHRRVSEKFATGEAL